MIAAALGGGGCSLAFDVGALPDGGLDSRFPTDGDVPTDGSSPESDGSGGGVVDGGAQDTGSHPAPGPPQYIGNSAKTLTGTKNVTTAMPPGAKAGDLLIAAVYSNDSTSSITPPTGQTWTTIKSSSNCTAKALWAYHVIGASDGSSYTFISGDTNDTAIALVAYRGVDATTPLASDREIFNSLGNSDPYGPISVTADKANETVVMMPVNVAADGTGNPNWGSISGTTKPVDIGTLAVYQETATTSGQTPSRTPTVNTGDHCGAVVMVAVRPTPQ
ncbi:MAG TPA: hypothetical protein VNO21_17755 [Polyangiaceae bacterium]|nr:hypothetical protein [Polyangiaceae bacterium]